MAFELSNELFINMRPEDIPPYIPKKHYFDQPLSTLQFWENERQKFQKGINIGGYFVHPWLYFHLNFFKTPIPTDSTNSTGQKDKVTQPPLDDLMYYIIENFKKAEELEKILCLFGTRGATKTTFSASHIHWTLAAKGEGNYTVTGGNAADLGNIARLARTSFNNVDKMLYIPTLEGSWGDKLSFGFKDKSNSGSSYVHAELLFINQLDGAKKKSEKTAGFSPIGYLTDEIGKFDFLDGLEAARPGFKNELGLRFTPILSGTSGNIVLTKDAQAILNNPKDYGVLEMDWDLLAKLCPENQRTWEHELNKNFGTFVPGQMSRRLDRSPRIKKSFGDFIGLSNKHLNVLKINVTDWDKANAEIDELVNVVDKKLSDRNKMYYPRELAHCFLTEAPNPFPVYIAKPHLEKLREEGKVGRPVELLRQDGKTKTVFSQKTKADIHYNNRPEDAPIMVYGNIPEVPPEKFMFGGGLDDYKTATSTTTNSLGAFYILKRKGMELNQPCETIAASYVARPDPHEILHNTIEVMVETWSSETLIEAIDVSFESHMIRKKKDGLWLSPAMSFSSSSQNKTAKQSARKYGLPATAQNKEYCFNNFVNWCYQEHTTDILEDGTKVVKYGIEFIEDPDLLEEIIEYQPGGNYDRITAFAIALVLVQHWDENKVRPKKQLNSNRIQNTDEDTYVHKPKHVNSKYSVTKGNSKYGNLNKKY